MVVNYARRYVGVGKATFLRDVGTIWPKPKHIGRRRVWDRLELDRAVDKLSDGTTDPLMEALET